MEAKTTVQSAHEAVERARDVGGGNAGTIVIGTTPTGAASAVAAVVHELARRYPTIEPEVVIGQWQKLLPALESGELDVVFEYDIAWHRSILVESLRSEPILAVVGLDNPLAEREAVGVGDLLAQPLAISGDLVRSGGDPTPLAIFRRRGLLPELCEHSPAGPDWERSLRASGFALVAESAPHHPATKRLRILDVHERLDLAVAWNPRHQRVAVERLLESARTLAAAG